MLPPMPVVPPSSRSGGLPLGLTGATAATRYVGATTGGAPASGTFAVGDFVIDQTGKVFVCTVAGTPGTWAQVGGGAPSGAAGGWLGGNYPNPTLMTDVVAAADQSIASSAVLTNDAELFFTATAGKHYLVWLYLVYGSPAGAGTPDLKCAFGEDATGRGTFSGIGLSNTDAAFTLTPVVSNQTALIILGTAAADRSAWFFGTHDGNGGTFRFLWAQNTSGANATIRRAGSVLMYQLII